MALDGADDLGDVLGLVADALHVGDHLQRGGDLPEIPGHRLLLEQQFQALGLDLPLLLVDLPVQGSDLFCQGAVPRQDGLGGEGDDLLAEGSHLDESPVQQRELLVKAAAHGRFLLPPGGR